MTVLSRLEHIFILVPSAVSDSPVKGAVALANGLCEFRPVTFVAIKNGKGAEGILDDRINKLYLGEQGSWLQRLLNYRKYLHEAGGEKRIASLSSCFSADMFNGFCRDLAITCTTVRGNLPKVYPETYGPLGKWLAYLHLYRLRNFDFVVSMTKAMSGQVEKYIKKGSPVIGNFLDELSLEKYRNKKNKSGPLRFVYVGSLLPAKQPNLLLDAVAVLKKQGIDVCLDIYGDGPLLTQLLQQAEKEKLGNIVKFHGYMPEPYAEISKADVFVLPSITEGMSRSAMEALYLGVPCILRDVDGNSELLDPGVNGNLFSSDNELPGIMLETALKSRQNISGDECLLPYSFRQDFASKQFLQLLEGDLEFSFD